MTPRPYVLAEQAWPAAAEAGYRVAVLPWGATEAHNRHLPYSTDTVQAEAVAIAAAGAAWDRGGRAVVLPAVPFGVQTGQLDIPLCLNLNPSTQAAVLADVVASLEPLGLAALVLLNGHGGNDFRQMIRELQPRTRMVLCQVNWWSCVDPKPFFAEPGDHAGELETSVMLATAPEWVRPLASAGPGAVRRPVIRGFREGWAWTPRRWTQVTADTGVGNPAQATAEKGERFFAAVAERIAGFLVELSTQDLTRLYE